ncbi:SDR family oxidoreductase [Hirschia maritima]|uniref:SDR family oxidoreductase n=1 Tax=Hirschia maritima TaxID=1121961 RepID=UPI0003650396|nr:SDR family oxidoreductase [Hirschia maritima]
MHYLTGKTAIITGASKGIGLATARELAKNGVRVVLSARSTEKLEEETDRLKNEGLIAASITADVSNYSEVEHLVRSTLEIHGQIDILVNNAGTIDPISRLESSNPDDWAKAMDINVNGVYFGMRAVIPIMLKQGHGTIINMSSGAANSALEGWSHYCSSKAAVKKLTECANVELGPKGINVIGLSPGTVATDMMAKIKQSGINPVSKLDWDGHISPEWPAKAVSYLSGIEGKKHAGTDFSIKTEEGRQAVGLTN